MSECTRFSPGAIHAYIQTHRKTVLQTDLQIYKADLHSFRHSYIHKYTGRHYNFYNIHNALSIKFGILFSLLNSFGYCLWDTLYMYVYIYIIITSSILINTNIYIFTKVIIIAIIIIKHKTILTIYFV